jgi:hypothetical protein
LPRPNNYSKNKSLKQILIRRESDTSFLIDIMEFGTACSGRRKSFTSYL